MVDLVSKFFWKAVRGEVRSFSVVLYTVLERRAHRPKVSTYIAEAAIRVAGFGSSRDIA